MAQGTCTCSAAAFWNKHSRRQHAVQSGSCALASSCGQMMIRVAMLVQFRSCGRERHSCRTIRPLCFCGTCTINSKNLRSQNTWSSVIWL